MTPTNVIDASIGFVGGGNMASAIMGGLIAAGVSPKTLCVIEPHAPTRDLLLQKLGVQAHAQATADLQACDLLVWAVKPQSFQEAALASKPHLSSHTLHLSVAAGIRLAATSVWTSSRQWVRAMPNTPALIGEGITGLFAHAHVSEQGRQVAQQVMAVTGQVVWVAQEKDLDAVTAMSGSGPAYVFYFLEAMVQAGERMGLTQAQAKQLALATFQGATRLAQQSDEPLGVLRERVTSKGGTTHAALEVMRDRQVAQHIEQALVAAQTRAQELGEAYGS